MLFAVKHISICVLSHCIKQTKSIIFYKLFELRVRTVHINSLFILCKLMTECKILYNINQEKNVINIIELIKHSILQICFCINIFIVISIDSFYK